MNINNSQKTEIAFHLKYLSNFENNGYKIEQINFSTKEVLFSKESETNKYKMKFEEILLIQNMAGENNLTSKNNLTSENDLTSEMKTDNLMDSDNLSETSEDNETSLIKKPISNPFVSEKNNNQKGGNNKNIFKSSKYSETSSVKFNELSNYSKTSSVMYNDRTDNFSDTSVIGQMGGGLETSDTLMSISELKNRKKSNSNMLGGSTSFKSSLDISIFKKSKSQSQSGGGTHDLKKKMLEAGINSSSTSSICE